MPEDIVTVVEAFIECHDLSPVSFGRMAMRDPHFVRDLRNGRRLWPETETKVRAFIQGYRPVSDERLAAGSASA